MAQTVWITGVGSLTNLGLGLDSLITATLKPRSRFLDVPQAWQQYSGAPAAFMSQLEESGESVLSSYTTVSTDRATAVSYTHLTLPTILRV